jgi:hypothetical protein
MESFVIRADWKTRKEHLTVTHDTIVVNLDGTVGVLKAGTVLTADMPVDGSLKLSSSIKSEER